MEENPTGICELLVGLGKAEVLGVNSPAPTSPNSLRIGPTVTARPSCATQVARRAAGTPP